MFYFVKHPSFTMAAVLLSAAVAVQGQSRQSDSVGSTAVITLQNGTEAANCPVGVQAQMRSGGTVRSTGNESPDKNGASALGRPGQQIRLILDASEVSESPGQEGQSTAQSRRPLRPIHVRVTVRGTSGSGRILNSAAGAGDSLPRSASETEKPLIEKTLIQKSLSLDLIAPTTRDGRVFYADLNLPGFTSVQTIRLDALVYADGKSWSPISGRVCRVTPDPLMLISNR